MRVKILYLFSDFVLDHGIDASLIIDEILLLLKGEESSKVINQAFTSLLRIGQSSNQEQVPQSVLSKIVEVAKLRLTSINHNVQRHAIQLIGAFSSIDEAEKELMAMISHYMDSSDARVRAQSMNSLLCMGSRSIQLPASLYSRAEKALKDDYECGRREALQLIYELSQRHPECLIRLDSQTEVRLIDDAFGKICSAISDLSMQIRSFAAELLGGLWQVNSEFLFQTLDKKLMSNMRRKKTSHERALENYTSGEWSSGRKWADDAPQEYLPQESISLIDSGACGALVQGLEDEFYEVRIYIIYLF